MSVTLTLNYQSCGRWAFVGITEGNVKLLSRNMNALSRGETRALIGGVNIHIFVFCRRISFEINLNDS